MALNAQSLHRLANPQANSQHDYEDSDEAADRIGSFIADQGHEIDEVLDAEMADLSLDAEPSPEFVGKLQGIVAALGAAGQTLKHLCRGVTIEIAHEVAEEMQAAKVTDKPDRLAALIFFMGKLASVGG